MAETGYKKKGTSPGNIPLGTGTINKAKTGIQRKRKAQYDAMRDAGMMSDEEYKKQMHKLGL
tara:strand:+ start:108 stop:293 length:186 start_codon:yes stop_codon:yes gene_type:complete